VTYSSIFRLTEGPERKRKKKGDRCHQMTPKERKGAPPAICLSLDNVGEKGKESGLLAGKKEGPCPLLPSVKEVFP